MSRDPVTPADPLRELIEAAYGGWDRPDDDPGILLAIADWMDRLDDVADALGSGPIVNRAMQADLRRIADDLRGDDDAS